MDETDGTIESTTGAQAPAMDLVARRDALAGTVVRKLAGRSLVLVGMMGAGKTSVGKRLAARLGLDFVDADHEIEAAAGLTIPEIFARHGEPHFRDGERRVIARLLGERQRVLATGGGAFMTKATRKRIAETGLSIWLKADAEVLLRRVRKRNNRPMLNTPDPEDTLKRLIDERYPTYGLADITVMSRDGPYEAVIDSILESLDHTLVGHQTGETRTIVPVELADGRYEIHIGRNLISRAGELIGALDPRAACFIVADRNVARFHLEALEKSLSAANIRHSHFIVEPGEASKSYEGFARLCDAAIVSRFERSDVIVALGGGMVGDLAGFAAASLRRGMRLVQLPTSIPAQVDSSVGGKTAIHSPHGKNLVGAFHQPALVLADTDVLRTLDPRQFRAGYAEIARFGLIDDAPFFSWLESNWRSIFAFGPELAEAIRCSCRSKAAMVARDDTEQRDRALLNLGHTFGHALELLIDFDTARLAHGEAVAIGMACAFRFSVRLGHASAAAAARVEHHLRDVGLPTRISDMFGREVRADTILDAMLQDTKGQRGALTFILARSIGQSFIAKGVPAEDVRAFLADELANT